MEDEHIKPSCKYAALDMQLAVFCYEVEKHEFWNTALKMGLEHSEKTEVSSANACAHFRDQVRARKRRADKHFPKLSHFCQDKSKQ